MNAPFIWIVFPLVISLILFLLGHWEKFVLYLGIVSSVFLAGLSWVLPVGQVIKMGQLIFEIEPSWVILGRKFTLEASDKPLVLIFNLMMAFWFFGMVVINIRPGFIAGGMAISALLTAAILVTPYFYGVILLFLAGLLIVSVLAYCEGMVSKGMVRFWVFQTFALPFLLLIGWMLTGTETNPSELSQVQALAIFASLGFALLMGLFPFHSWLSMISEKSDTYLVGFIYLFLPFTTSIYAMSFLQIYNWLYSSTWVLFFLRIEGLFMLVIGGFGAAFQRHIGKLMGFCMMIEIGNIILALSLGLGGTENRLYQALIFPQLLPRAIALAILALSLHLFRQTSGELSFAAIAGAGRKFPVASISFFISILSLVGYPLTAGFPAHLLIWQTLFQQFPLAGFVNIFGSVGVLIGGLRGFSTLVRGGDDVVFHTEENQSQVILLGLGLVALLVLGLIPQIYFPTLLNMGFMFLGGS